MGRKMSADDFYKTMTEGDVSAPEVPGVDEDGNDVPPVTEVGGTPTEPIVDSEGNEIETDKQMQYTARRVYDKCCKFLASQRLINGNFRDIMNNRNGIVSMEAFNNNANFGNLGAQEIRQLVKDCGVPRKMQGEAVKAVKALLSRIRASNGSNDAFRMQHFDHGTRKDITQQALDTSVTTVFSPALRAMAKNIGIPSQEAFGASIDKVLPDIRESLAITLLQFHRGLLDRIIHRRTSASPYIKYVVPYAEVYDMLKSNDPSAEVRNNGDHIVPFIELYGDPRVVSNQLQKIIPLAANDTAGVLAYDGVVKFQQKANLFDLSVLPNQLGKTHYNYTDLVSENVNLDKIIIKLQNNGTAEQFAIDVSEVNNARFNMQPNVNDSGIRACNLDYTVRLDKNTLTATGVPSKILAKCTDTDYIRVHLRAAVSISLKYADVEGFGYVKAEAYNRNHAQVADEVNQLAANTTVELVGYAVDARYSEENLRKSNLAVRWHTRTFDFEISNGRNILVDYSMQEELPEFLMSLVTEATSLGQDHRGIDVIIKEMMHVYDVTNCENNDPDFRDRLDKVGFQYVASQLVRPVVYLNTIDLDNVDTIRSGDILGDIRQYVEWELINLTSLYFQNSFYRHQLAPGEKPVFKVFTSSIILDNLFNIPHYHNHLNTDEPADGSTVEFRHVLPSGVILECVSVTFNYMRDKIVMIPYRPNEPNSELNWGHNWDFGTFVAHYNPQLDNAVNKRVFSNTRAMVVPTNPSGIYLDVQNISKLINMFQVANPVTNGTQLEQPADNIVTGF